MEGWLRMRSTKSLALRQEHGVVVGIGAVPRIRQPEILPHHHPMAVAGIVELILADLADPVADHVEVHLGVVAHGGVVLPRAVAQHGFAEAPVAALGNEAAAVDPHAQRAAFLAVGELAHAGLEPLRVGNRAGGGFELQADVVKIRLAVSGGPPEFGVGQLQGVAHRFRLRGLERRPARRMPRRRSGRAGFPKQARRRGWRG